MSDDFYPITSNILGLFWTPLYLSTLKSEVIYGPFLINFHFVSDCDEDEDEIVDDDALSQLREEPASLEDLPSDQFDMPKRETSV